MDAVQGLDLQGAEHIFVNPAGVVGKVHAENYADFTVTGCNSLGVFMIPRGVPCASEVAGDAVAVALVRLAVLVYCLRFGLPLAYR